MTTTIVLIGPICAGKSTTSRLLADRLGLDRIELDELRWNYYRELGYDEEMAALLKSSEAGLLERSTYWKPFEAYAVERVVADHKNCVLDFGAGNAVFEDKALFNRVQNALALIEHVILILPSPNLDESTAILNARFSKLLQEVAGTVNPEALLLNEHFVKHPSSRRLAKTIIYTGNQTPEEVCDELVNRIGRKV